MGFSIQCDNKGCGKYQEPKLNLETNDVECADCGQPIKSVTSFAKNQMKSLGQIKRAEQTQQAFSVQCANCKKSAPPVLSGKDILCAICKKELSVSAPYAAILREKFKNT